MRDGERLQTSSDEACVAGEACVASQHEHRLKRTRDLVRVPNIGIASLYIPKNRSTFSGPWSLQARESLSHGTSEGMSYVGLPESAGLLRPRGAVDRRLGHARTALSPLPVRGRLRPAQRGQGQSPGRGSSPMPENRVLRHARAWLLQTFVPVLTYIIITTCNNTLKVVLNQQQ